MSIYHKIFISDFHGVALSGEISINAFYIRYNGDSIVIKLHFQPCSYFYLQFTKSLYPWKSFNHMIIRHLIPLKHGFKPIRIFPRFPLKTAFWPQPIRQSQNSPFSLIISKPSEQNIRISRDSKSCDPSQECHRSEVGQQYGLEFCNGWHTVPEPVGRTPVILVGRGGLYECTEPARSPPPCSCWVPVWSGWPAHADDSSSNTADDINNHRLRGKLTPGTAKQCVSPQ